MANLRETTNKTPVPNTLQSTNHSVAVATGDQVLSKITIAASHGDTVDDQIEELKARLGHGAASEYATGTTYAVGDEVYWRDGSNVLHFYYRLTAGQDASGSNPSTLSAVWREAISSLNDVPIIGDDQNSTVAILQRGVNGAIDFNTQIAIDLANTQNARQVRDAIDAELEKASNLGLWRGTWAHSTNYIAGQYVVYSNILYRRRNNGQDQSSETPNTNTTDWFRITGVEVHIVQRLRDIYELREARIDLDPAQANRGQIIQRDHSSEGYFYANPTMRWRGAWNNTDHYYFLDVVTHFDKLWVLTGENHITAVASGNGTIPGTFAPWVDLAITEEHLASWARQGSTEEIPRGKLPDDIGLLESSETIDYNQNDGELHLKPPGSQEIWGAVVNGVQNTGEVQSRSLRDKTSFDTSDTTVRHYTMADVYMDNVRNGYTYFRNVRGPTGDGWQIDNGQHRGWSGNSASTDILINRNNTRLRGQYRARLWAADRNNRADLPEQITVNLRLVGSNTVIASDVAYDLSRHTGTIPIAATEHRQSTVFGSIPDSLNGLIDRASANKEIRVNRGHYMQATLRANVVSNPGEMELHVVQIPTRAGGSVSYTRNRLSENMSHANPTRENPATFEWENIFNHTDGSHSIFYVVVASWNGAAVHAGALEDFVCALEVQVEDDGGRDVTIDLPDRTYQAGDRLWISADSQRHSPNRIVGMVDQTLTLYNADDTTGRHFNSSGGSTAPYGHVAFSGTAATSWWQYASSGILEAKRDVRKASFTVTIPTLAAANVVRLWRQRSGELGEELLGQHQIVAGSGGTISVETEAVRAGDLFNVVLDTPVTASGWSIAAHAQTAEGLNARQVRTKGLIDTQKVLNQTRNASHNTWARMDQIQNFRWSEHRVIYVAFNPQYNIWDVRSIHTALLQELNPLAVARLGQQRSNSDHYIEITRALNNDYGHAYLAPIADGGIAIAVNDNDGHPVKIWVE